MNYQINKGEAPRGSVTLSAGESFIGYFYCEIVLVNSIIDDLLALRRSHQAVAMAELFYNQLKLIERSDRMALVMEFISELNSIENDRELELWS